MHKDKIKLHTLQGNKNLYLIRQKNTKEYFNTGWKKKYYKILSQNANKEGTINRRKIMHELKSNGCAICGYDKCDRALEFHHVNPEDKKFNITQTRLGLSEKKVIEELNKCILLCSNCHREIEQKNFNKN